MKNKDSWIEKKIVKEVELKRIITVYHNNPFI